MATTFKIVKIKEWDEYQVQVFENGKLNKKRTYHTDDQQDAIDTWKAMVNEDKKKKKGKIHFMDKIYTRRFGEVWQKNKSLCHKKEFKKLPSGFRTTKDPEKVTCKNCIAILKQGE